MALSVSGNKNIGPRGVMLCSQYHSTARYDIIEAIIINIIRNHDKNGADKLTDMLTNMCTYTANVIEKSEARGEARGISKGEKKLAEAISEYRDNVPYNELVDKYGETTAKLAVELA